MQLLLECGANPDAAAYRGATALNALALAITIQPQKDARARMAALLLQHGASCLWTAYHGVGFEDPSFEALLLTHLEHQCCTGQLELGSAAQAAELLLVAVWPNREQLLTFSLGILEMHWRVAGRPPTEDEAECFQEILRAAIRLDSAAVLQAVLASSLPLVLNPPQLFRAPLLWAALRWDNIAKVQLLHRAGARVAANTLLVLIDRSSKHAVAGLLSAGRPAVDVSQPSLEVVGTVSYSGPIHRALHHLVRLHGGSACAWACQQIPAARLGRRRLPGVCTGLNISPSAGAALQAKQIPLAYEGSTLHLVELLLAAGCRPTVYRHTAPPPFLHRGSEVLEVFDPFDYYCTELSPRCAATRLVQLLGLRCRRCCLHSLCYVCVARTAEPLLLVAGALVLREPVASPTGGSQAWH